MDRLFLLDAYALIYRAYYAFIKNPRINSKGINTSAILGFVNTLEEVIRKENPSHIGIAFDPAGPTFRHEAYAEYKAQREETPEAIRTAVPIIKDIIRAYRIPILEVNGFEADDVIGTLATQASRQENLETYMMTPDKDYGQLVGELVKMYRPKFGDKEFEVMGVEEITKKFGISSTAQVIDMLGLMGDTADNIPGCPGVGEKTASKLIGQFGSIENLLAHTDELKGSLKEKVETNRELITFSKFLATIRTDVPITLDLDLLKTKEADADQLKALFEDLEFRTILERKFKRNKPASETHPLQGSLFAEFADESPKESEYSNLNRYEKALFDYQLIETKEDRKRIIDLFVTNGFLSLDTETTGTDPIRARLVGLSFSIKENQAFYVPIPKDPEEAQKIMNEFKPVYENEHILKIGQNIKYDLMVLQNYGVELHGEIFDTMIAHYLLQPELRHGMDYLAEVYLNYQTIHIEELIGPKGKNQKNMADLPPARVYEYACEDADVTLKLKNIFEPKLKAEGCYDLFRQIEMPLMPVLAWMERNGVCIDTDALKETSLLYTEQMNRLEKEIHEMAGESFNISSPKQVGEILFEKLKISEKAKKTKKGQYVTSEEVLETLRAHHPIVEKILEHRGLKKLLGTYIDALPKLINPETGHIHTSFNQTITATGRLSSSNPNLQNIPVRNEEGKEIRKAFIPEPGCEFFSADYSQIELRIMAHLSGDPHMIEAFREGYDIHAATAAKIYKKPMEEVTREERSEAKTANFGIIYGITVFGLAERMNVSRNEAKDLIDGYFATYPKVKEYMQKSIEVAREKGYTETLYHRKCYLRDINSHNAVVRGYAERNAINAPIQGSAADIIKIAMIAIYRRFREEGLRSKMILQVHDELNFSVYPEEKQRVQQIVIEEMEHACTMQVPLEADYGWGKNWLEAH
ncbi:MAG: DNA polymerase I [Paraprevotella sp.]|nr:DNA polymerase I [Paraprevotella sp.]